MNDRLAANYLITLPSQNDPNRIFDFRESGRSLDVPVPETEALADPRALRRCASGAAIREAEAIVV